MHIVKSTSFDSKKKREEEKAKKNNGRVSKCAGRGQIKKEKAKMCIEDHPGCQYTAFACGRLGTDVSICPDRPMNESGYCAIVYDQVIAFYGSRDRPMNESGYCAIEEQMLRTRSTDPATRLFCFAIILYNMMIVANHELIAMSRYPLGAKPWHTHDVMVGEFLNVLKSLLEEIGCPEPKPPTPLPS